MYHYSFVQWVAFAEMLWLGSIDTESAVKLFFVGNSRMDMQSYLAKLAGVHNQRLPTFTSDGPI
jgi:hypothetical protein